MGRKKATRGNIDCTPHEKKHECVCSWCGIKFKSSRDDSRTCSPKHRNALSRYIRRHGRAPDSPQTNYYPFGRYHRNRNL